jgi:hypothetical protein
MRIDELIELLFSRMREAAFKNMYHERISFDPISEKVMGYIVSRSINDGVRQFSNTALLRIFDISKKMMASRLRALARYGLIRVTYLYSDDRLGFFNGLEIEVNPIIVGLYKTGAANRNIKHFVDHYYKIGFMRLDIEDKCVQGFYTHCEYGYKEPETSEAGMLQWKDKLFEIIENVDSKKAEKQKDNLMWMDISNEFVAGCAKLWTKGQGQMGYGYNDPVWGGEISLLSPTAKRERSELVKLFQSYGGLTTAIAWFIFVCGVPEKDDMGKLIFDLTAPHRQFVTIDRKPSQFAKHFNAILSDLHFKNFISQSEDTIAMLKKFYSDCVNVKQRYEKIQTEL